MVTEAARQNPQTGEARTTGHVSGLTFVKVLMMERLRIKAQRIKMGYTQEQLAEEMCVPKSTISAYENDKVDIKSSVIVELSNKLGTTPNYLLGFEKKNDFSDSIAALVSNVTEDKVRTLIFKQISSILDFFTA